MTGARSEWAERPNMRWSIPTPKFRRRKSLAWDRPEFGRSVEENARVQLEWEWIDDRPEQIRDAY